LRPTSAATSGTARECRIERNVRPHPAAAGERDVKATFFTLGWIAERYPQLVRRIVAGGHELASHGYGHERASDLDHAAFTRRHACQEAAGRPVRRGRAGYRAPSFSIGTGNLWAFDVLAQAGYRYSSSIYPLKHDHYGMPDSPRFAYRVGNGLLEVPVTTLRVMNRNLPSSGGGYFRLLPYSLSRWMIRRVNREDGEAAIFYFHPWEIDVDQPRVAGIDAKTRFRHYVNIPRMDGRLQSLLADFRWGRMDQIFLAARCAGLRNH
jgi:polysaccharide deacetylase family protein (PEP-CTERM system associated)